MVVHLCEYTKNYWIIHFKVVSCKVCELYLDEAIEEKVTKKKTL